MFHCQFDPLLLLPPSSLRDHCATGLKEGGRERGGCCNQPPHLLRGELCPGGINIHDGEMNVIAEGRSNARWEEGGGERCSKWGTPISWQKVSSFPSSLALTPKPPTLYCTHMGTGHPTLGGADGGCGQTSNLREGGLRRVNKLKNSGLSLSQTIFLE